MIHRLELLIVQLDKDTIDQVVKHIARKVLNIKFLKVALIFHLIGTQCLARYIIEVHGFLGRQYLCILLINDVHHIKYEGVCRIWKFNGFTFDVGVVGVVHRMGVGTHGHRKVWEKVLNTARNVAPVISDGVPSGDHRYLCNNVLEEKSDHSLLAVEVYVLELRFWKTQRTIEWNAIKVFIKLLGNPFDLLLT